MQIAEPGQGTMTSFLVPKRKEVDVGNDRTADLLLWVTGKSQLVLPGVVPDAVFLFVPNQNPYGARDDLQDDR